MSKIGCSLSCVDTLAAFICMLVSAVDPHRTGAAQAREANPLRRAKLEPAGSLRCFVQLLENRSCCARGARVSRARNLGAYTDRHLLLPFVRPCICIYIYIYVPYRTTHASAVTSLLADCLAPGCFHRATGVLRFSMQQPVAGAAAALDCDTLRRRAGLWLLQRYTRVHTYIHQILLRLLYMP